MKKKYFIYVFLIMILVVMLSGCGVDTSTLAGNASQVASDSATTVEEKESATTESEKLLYDSSDFLHDIPAWDGSSPYIEINNNVPDFTADEIWTSTQESLDSLDSLGRCGAANSCIGTDGMPTEGRGDISDIHPTGWHSDKYDFVEGGNLFNRCHLIGHKLSGDDAVPRNLITGTSYMNREGMLPFEDEIYEYVKSTDNHVMYRVVPCFEGNDLVARGVHMQAISVEDDGEGVAFNVFCYNVQPRIVIDYATGENALADSEVLDNETADNKLEEEANTEEQTEDDRVVTVILNTNKSRKRIHIKGASCAEKIGDNNKQEWTGTVDELIEFANKEHYVACGSCHPDQKLKIDLPTKQ